MASNRMISFGPAFIANAAANILNGAITSLAGPVGFSHTQPILWIRRLRLVNKTSSAVTVTLYIGATGASASGTEFLGATLTIQPFSYLDFVANRRLISTEFLTGVASAATAVTIEGDLEIGF